MTAAAVASVMCLACLPACLVCTFVSASAKAATQHPRSPSPLILILSTCTSSRLSLPQHTFGLWRKWDLQLDLEVVHAVPLPVLQNLDLDLLTSGDYTDRRTTDLHPEYSTELPDLWARSSITTKANRICSPILLLSSYIHVSVNKTRAYLPPLTRIFSLISERKWDLHLWSGGGCSAWQSCSTLPRSQHVYGV